MEDKGEDGGKAKQANDPAAWAVAQPPALPPIACARSAGISKFTNAVSPASSLNARRAVPR